MRRLTRFAVFAFLCATSFAQHPAANPEFGKYRVTDHFHGPNAPVQLVGDARMYRTRLRAASKLGPNFAGHYRLVDWGCGSGCVQIAVINLTDGHVTFFPYTLSWVNEAEYGVHATRYSRAVRMVGALNEQDSADRWYEWDGGTFRLIEKHAAKVEPLGAP